MIYIWKGSLVPQCELEIILPVVLVCLQVTKRNINARENRKMISYRMRQFGARDRNSAFGEPVIHAPMLAMQCLPDSVIRFSLYK
jgi:hypothetical protein